MKKTLAIVLALVMMLAFVACGAKATPAEVYTAESDWFSFSTATAPTTSKTVSS